MKTEKYRKLGLNQRENGELRGKVLKARHYIVEMGYTISKTAELMKLNPETLNAWFIENNWREQIQKHIEKITKLQIFLNDFTPPENLGSHETETKKYLAAYMVTVKFLEQKEVSRILKVSPTSISKWSQDGKWREKVKKMRSDLYKLNSIAPKRKLADTDHFLEWVKVEHSRYYPYLNQLYSRYLQNIQERIDKTLTRWQAIADAYKLGNHEEVKRLSKCAI